MPPRARRFVAFLGVMAFLGLWIWGAISLAEILPDIWWVDLLFFTVAGVGWGIPLIPLLRWAEKPVPGHTQNNPEDPF